MLSRLSVRSQILALERRNVENQNDAAILELALAEGLASSQTSFVAVEQKENAHVEEQKENAQKAKDEMHGDATEACKLEETVESAVLDCEVMESVPESLKRHLSLSRSLSRSRRRSGGYSEEADDDLMGGLPDFDECNSSCLESCLESESRFDWSPDHRRLSCSSKKSVSMMRCAGPSSLSMRGKGGKGGPFAAAASLTAAAKSFGDKVGAVASRSCSVLQSLRNPGLSKSARALPATPRTLPHAAVLQVAHGTGRYQGTLTHPALGPEAQQLTVVIQQVAGPGEHLGIWAAMGQVEEVRVSITESSLLHIKIQNTAGTGTTLLEGVLVNGSIHGSCVQDGVGGGSFDLHPVGRTLYRIELTDTDGDSLVFLKSIDGCSVAEYCNGELVEADVRELGVDTNTCMFRDPSGKFQLPLAQFEQAVVELAELLESVGGKLVIKGR